MNHDLYTKLKTSVNTIPLSACVMAVKKDESGNFAEMRYFAINNSFINDSIALFFQDESDLGKSHEDKVKEIESRMEGSLYTINVQKEPKFEANCFKAAWKKEPIHTYVDTTKLYGYWTENYMLPITVSKDETAPDTAYCMFLYTLNKDMDVNKFSAVSPEIASFVIKTCLELQSEKDFYSSMQLVTDYIREYTHAFGASVMSYQSDQQKYEVISGSTVDNVDIKEIFSHIPFSIVASWERLLKHTNAIIIKDEADLEYYEKEAPEWVKTLRDSYVYSLCLVPFLRQNTIIGYLYIANFDVESLTKVKAMIELVSFFLSAEVANHLFLERLEYLSNIDILTGVKNRNCMNADIEEFTIKFSFKPIPFSVAFCDINGLKIINDNQGHSAGDKLIAAAADLLKEIFNDDNIYRAGGDEFAIISTRSSEHEFEEKIEKLKELTGDPDHLCFAVGFYHDDGSGSLQHAMRYADERMYRDKNLFYEKHPDMRR
ncbi:MAG: sensor domain-containing diguanylate cyclase [Butyrivibrio sp.]|nr:sensor domain-containing diguanylate cyclase [Butyrivibrio sp.]